MIEKLLTQIGEDKHTNPTTTSNKFKTDLWNFCKENGLGGTAVEYGTHKGATTRILAHLFDTVYTCNLPNHFDQAKLLNLDLINIVYVGIDLYNSDLYESLTSDSISLFFVDAIHTHDAVITDFTRSTNMNCADPCYFVFDDTGLYPEVLRAVNDLVWMEKLEIVKEIGHPKGYDFGSGRILNHGAEGLICKLIN